MHQRRPTPITRLAVVTLLIGLGLVPLGGCTLPHLGWPQEVRGNLTDLDSIAAVKPGSTTKAELVQLIGSPSAVSTFDPKTWYYIGQRLQRDTLTDPILLEQRVYVAHFDDKGVVIAFDPYINQAYNVDMIPRATPAPGKELSFIEQILGNFGRFSGDDKKKPGGAP